MMHTTGHVYLDNGRCQGCGARREDASSTTETCPTGGAPAPVEG